MLERIQKELISHQNVVQKVIAELQSHIYTASIMINETIKNNGKVFIFGNGQNAIISELFVHNFNKKYTNLAVSLSSNPFELTAIANGYGYDRVFDKQIENLAKKDDLLIGISTSGNSKNVLRALSLGQNMNCKTIGLSGHDGGAMEEFCDINLVVPSDDTPRIQEMHIMIGHIICQAIDV
jgi:D-sedoheptulose 7-phosphate isomerase